MLSRTVRNSDYSGVRRFSNPKPEKMDRKFWQAHFSDTPPTPPAGEKYTLEEAKAKLRDDGWAVMKQDAFNRIIDEKHGDGYNKAKKEFEGQGGDSAALKKEVEKLQGQIAELKKDKPDMIPKSEHEQILAAKENEIKKRDESISKMSQHQLDNELLKAVANKAVDPSDVLALTRANFQLGEDGKVFHVNEKGEKVIDSDGSYLGPDRYFDKFFKEKPHLAKASDSQGAGSSTNGTGGKTGDGFKIPAGYNVKTTGGA